MERYHIAIDGKDMGAVPVDVIREMVNDGRLSGTDFYFDDAKGQWRPVMETFRRTIPSPPRSSARGGPKRGVGCVGLLFISVAAFVVFAFIIGMNEGSSGGQGSHDARRREAWGAAKYFVKESLKAPTTAKFPSLGDPGTGIAPNGAGWRVEGYVDSQNSFGAMIRTKWMVDVTQDGENWKRGPITTD